MTERMKKKPRPARIPKDETKDGIGLRIYASDRVKVSHRYGSVQDFLDHVLDNERDLDHSETDGALSQSPGA
jgi:hypothetical protein